MKLAPMSDTGEQQECLSPATAQQLLATGGQLVDVRHPSDYEAGTLPGAMNLPLEALSLEHSRLNKRQPVILCCTRGLLRAGCCAAGQHVRWPVWVFHIFIISRCIKLALIR